MISHLRDVHRSHRLQSFVLPYRLRGFPKRQRGDFVFTVMMWAPPNPAIRLSTFNPARGTTLRAIEGQHEVTNTDVPV